MIIVVPPAHVIEEVERARRKINEQPAIQLPIPTYEPTPKDPDKIANV